MTQAPWEKAWDDAYVTSHSKCVDPLAETQTKYLSDLKAIVRGGVPAEADQVSIVYTAMHGVGYQASDDSDSQATSFFFG